MIAWLAAAQAVMSVPATSAPVLPPVTSGYSIVVARAFSQSDPTPIACGAVNCTSWFLGKFDRAENVAGAPLPAKFLARLEMGSPFISQYTLAMIVETLPDGSYRVRATHGFDDSTGLACFDDDCSPGLHPCPPRPCLTPRMSSVKRRVTTGTPTRPVRCVPTSRSVRAAGPSCQGAGRWRAGGRAAPRRARPAGSPTGRGRASRRAGARRA